MPPHVYSDPYQDDFFMMRITFSQRAFYFQSPVFCCMALLSAGIASSRQRLHKNENTAYSFTDISGIRFLYISTTNSQRLQTVVQHLVRLFIHADHQYSFMWGRSSFFNTAHGFPSDKLIRL